MEMTFPHQMVRQETVNGRQSCQAMLATVIARQANSRTARAVVLATRKSNECESTGDAIDERIHYFSSHTYRKSGPSGAFWATRRAPDTAQSKNESSVYQDASMNSKAHAVNGDGTGEQFNQAGHGATRTL